MRLVLQRLAANPAHVFELSRTELAGHLAAEEPILNDWTRPSIQLTGLPLASLLEESRQTLVAQ